MTSVSEDLDEPELDELGAGVDEQAPSPAASRPAAAMAASPRARE
ncbi:MAG TPA: hypothetical protein VMB74_15120 [Streptosporangiaceae bacterium]|nr:hypothetical protein [Streptosporangiaceae bacterium]